MMLSANFLRSRKDVVHMATCICTCYICTTCVLLLPTLTGARRWGMHAKPPAREDGAPAAGVGVTLVPAFENRCPAHD